MGRTERTVNSKRLASIVRAFAPLLALLILVVIMTLITPEFASVNNSMNVLRQTAVNGFLAAGMLLTLITAGIDLSVGTNAILSAAAMGFLMVTFGITNPFILLLMAIVTGTAVGMINGLLLTKLELPHPFVSTLGMKYVLAGLALFILATRTVSGFPVGVTALGSADLFKGGGFSGFRCPSLRCCCCSWSSTCCSTARPSAAPSTPSAATLRPPASRASTPIAC